MVFSRFFHFFLDLIRIWCHCRNSPALSCRCTQNCVWGCLFHRCATAGPRFLAGWRLFLGVTTSFLFPRVSGADGSSCRGPYTWRKSNISTFFIIWKIKTETTFLSSGHWYYHNDPRIKFSDRHAWANSADPDQQSDQCLHCLPFCLHCLDS